MSKQTLTVTLPDGKKLSRTTAHRYAYVAVARSKDGRWESVRWSYEARSAAARLTTFQNRRHIPEYYDTFLVLPVDAEAPQVPLRGAEVVVLRVIATTGKVISPTVAGLLVKRGLLTEGMTLTDAGRAVLDARKSA